MCEDCPMHQPVDDEETVARYERLLGTFDLGLALRRFAFGGFDTFADYAAYGEIFVPLGPRGAIPPESRKFYTPPPDPGV